MTTNKNMKPTKFKAITHRWCISLQWLLHIHWPLYEYAYHFYGLAYIYSYSYNTYYFARVLFRSLQRCYNINKRTPRIIYIIKYVARV